MRVNFGRTLFVAFGFFVFGADQQAQAQAPFRSGLPARPQVAAPQTHHHARPTNHSQFNPSPLGNNPNFNSFNNNNSGFNQQNSGFNNWNYSDLNAWNNLNMTGWPYWNTVASFNPFNPAQNFIWSQPTVPMNANPFMMNAAFTNMWNNFNMMNGGMNQFGMMGNAMPVGAWNGFNPAMGNGFNPGMMNGFNGFNPAALMNLSPNANGNGGNR
jgi:hypothetical protein